jgi:NAD(P)-dependent dehydrogenase (short-subunit alcohol dehydrogenase family)
VRGLRGQRALVTGASKGIGKALADALRAEGCEVFGCARTAGPGVLRCDVSVPEEVERLRARTGPVDLLVNNAAVIHEPAPLVDVPLAEWRRLLDTNVLGMVAVLKAYVPDMNARGAGVVCNLSSTWGRSVDARQAPYCATKWAVEGLSRALAEEVREGVVVLAVNPGVVATDMLATCFEGAIAGATPPGACAAAFVGMLRRVAPAWNGRSVDL